jgi:crotonobetainyl-CoA:carnitine CoA-transferase CaiB-like acyl-CoA transferase
MSTKGKDVKLPKPLPPPNSDFYQLAETLPPEELATLRQVRSLMESKAAPIINKYWVEDSFPFEMLPAFKELNLGGLGIQGYGCRGGSALLTGLVAMEMARTDASIVADLPGFDVTAYWSRSGLLSLTRDAGSPPTLPFAGTGDNPTAVGLYAAIVTGLYRRERTGKGSYVTTSLLAEGVWSASVAIQAALCQAKFSPQHDRKNPANAAQNVYKSSDGIWFMLVVTPDKIPAVAEGIGRSDLLTDSRFADPTKLAANMGQLTTIVDEIFSAQPMAHLREVFDKANITYGIVRDPSDVIKDPQLSENGIVVPLAGAGGNLKSTISSPIQVHGVTKIPAKRAPELGEHNEEILKELGFDAKEIDDFRASGTLGKSKEPAKGT